MEPLLFSCFLVSFLVTIFIIPKWIRKSKIMGLVGKDMNKPDKPKVPEAGGIAVIVGAVVGVLLYIFLNTFYFSSTFGLIEIFAVVTTILLAGFVGFIDDILGWKTGVRQTTKILSTVPIAIPLAVVNAGYSIMSIPYFGAVDFGFIFPLLIIPLGIIGATNGYNMLAGYNGLESSMGIVILGALGIVAWVSGSSWVSMIAFCMLFALIGFLLYNKTPARIFPGDSLTYAVGAMIACVAILGNMERVAVILFVPYFFDMAMFIRFRFFEKKKHVEAFAKVNEDGSLELPHEKIYDFMHLVLWFLKKVKEKVSERDVVLTAVGIEILLAAFAIWLWLIEL